MNITKKKNAGGNRLARKGKKKQKRSQFSKFISYLERTYGVEWTARGTNQYRAMLLVYHGLDRVPPIMPTPRGPANGAALSTKQYTSTFNGSTGISNSTITQNGSTAVLGAVSFELTDLQQVATFTALFDQYRIDKIHFRIRPRNQTINLASIASPNQASPRMYVVADHDDASAPAALTDLYQYDNVVELGPGDSADIILEPSITPAVYAGGAFTGYGVQSSTEGMWIDVANTSVPHYGIKFGLTGLQVSATYVYIWEIDAWYQISFRNVR